MVNGRPFGFWALSQACFELPGRGEIAPMRVHETSNLSPSRVQLRMLPAIGIRREVSSGLRVTGIKPLAQSLKEERADVT